MADLDRKNMDIRKESELSEEDYFGTGAITKKPLLN